MMCPIERGHSHSAHGYPTMSTRIFARCASLTFVVLLLATQPASSATSQEIDAYSNEALKKLFDDSPAAKELAAKAHGVLIFPRVWKGGIGIGAEAGEGVLRMGGRTADYYLLTGGSLGF